MTTSVIKWFILSLVILKVLITILFTCHVDEVLVTPRTSRTRLRIQQHHWHQPININRILLLLLLFTEFFFNLTKVSKINIDFTEKNIDKARKSMFLRQYYSEINILPVDLSRKLSDGKFKHLTFDNSKEANPIPMSLKWILIILRSIQKITYQIPRFANFFSFLPWVRTIFDFLKLLETGWWISTLSIQIRNFGRQKFGY